MNTKDYIASTFLHELENGNKSIQEFTVKHLCNLCKVSRETFYYHFNNKYDVISYIYQESKREIFEEKFGTEPVSNTLLRLLSLIRKYSNFFNKGFSENEFNILENKMNYDSFIFYINVYRKQLGTQLLSHEDMTFLHFDSYGFTGVIKKWLETDMVWEEANLAEVIYEAMSERTKIILNSYIDSKSSHNNRDQV